LAAEVGEGHEKATSEDGDENEDGGHERHHCHTPMTVAKSVPSTLKWKAGGVVGEDGLGCD
jgi:hypothetical protein